MPATTAPDFDLNSLLASYGLAQHAAALGALAVPALRIAAHPTPDGAIPPAASKLGGAPDLPPDWPWPTWQGTPLAFVAQLNMRETARFSA